MELHEGQIVDVVVSSVENYGVLVTFEDRQGILLETNIEWDCDGIHQKMFEMFKPGQRIRAKVMVITPKQFSVSIKDLHPENDPWWDPGIYAKGMIHQGTVSTLFEGGGGLVKLKKGLKVRVEDLGGGIGLGDEISVLIKDVSVERRTISAVVAHTSGDGASRV